MDENLRYIYVPDTVDPPSLDEVGGKALGLYRLRQAGLSVPPWFVVKASAWMKIHASHNKHADDGVNVEESCPEIENEIDSAIHKLGLDDTLLAVRSSATVEDANSQSFAGQFSTILHVHPENLMTSVNQVWASAESRHCKAYAIRHDLPEEKIIPAVVIQQMLYPEISGVMFTADPTTGDKNKTVISALYGQCEAIVNGSCNADTYYTDHNGNILSKDIPCKLHCVEYDPKKGGACRVPVAIDLQNKQVCPDYVIAEISALGKSITNQLGQPQDIEWCLADGKIYLLQTRPITSHAIPIDNPHDEPVRIWDNANLIESYPGITLPLTFSFIDSMYTGVYRQMCREAGLRESSLESKVQGFRMLGYYRGRVYYNLLNWYYLQSQIPGGSRHCRNFDLMLGTRGESSLVAKVCQHEQSLLRSMYVSMRLVANFVVLPIRIRRFLKRIRSARERTDSIDFSAHSLVGMVSLYNELESLLLKHWTTPQFNDFCCQTATGLLKSVIQLWLGEGYANHVHEVFPVQESVESEKAIISLKHLASMIQEIPELVDTCTSSDPATLLREIAKFPGIQAHLDKHVHLFGDRWNGELKLETVTPRENPEILMEVLASHVLASTSSENSCEASAIHEAIANLVFWKRWLANILIHLSQRYIANRENTRFERTRVFGIVRRIFRSIGRQLTARGHISRPEDVFYLTKDEIFCYINGTHVDVNLMSLVKARQHMFSQWQLQSLPGRFLTKGLLTEFQPIPKTASLKEGGILSGIGASQGIVRGRVKIVRTPDELGDARNCIVAAESTDPGWSFIFPLIAGILVERGSMLSHAAIVAREMKIPAVVAIDGLLERLPDNSLVELDGTSGIIKVIEADSNQRKN